MRFGVVCRKIWVCLHHQRHAFDVMALKKPALDLQSSAGFSLLS